MDSIRFGRVLGAGARLAGRTLVEAIDAATSEPERRLPGGHGVVLPPAKEATARREAGARAGQRTRATATGVRRGGRRFGEAVWGPMARASGVLWLEVTGLFFGLVALAGLDGIWLYRSALHWAASGRDPRVHLVVAAVLAVAFGYFCVSSFLTASRRTRG